MQISNPKVGGCATFIGITMINTVTGKTATALREKNGNISIRYSNLYLHLINFYKTKAGRFFKKIPVVREVVNILAMICISFISLFKSPAAPSKSNGSYHFVIKMILIAIILASVFFLNSYVQLGLMLALLIIFQKQLKVLFMYHGAEHKCIGMFEVLGFLPDNVQVAQKYPRTHIRCGTNITVILLPLLTIYAVFIENYLETLNEYLDFGCSLLLVGLILEIFRLMQKKNISWLFAPGLFIQKYITTKEPDDKKMEVAFAALKAVLD